MGNSNAYTKGSLPMNNSTSKNSTNFQKKFIFRGEEIPSKIPIKNRCSINRLNLFIKENVSKQGILPRALRRVRKIGHLEISFSLLNEYSSNELDILGRRLKRVRSLTSANLDLNFSARTSRKAFLNLTTSLSQLKGLKKLTLSPTRNINDSDLRCLSKSLRHLQKLNKLNVNLTLREGITDFGLNYLCVSLWRLKNLNSLHFNMWGLQNVTSQSIFSISQAISKLANISNLDLDFQGCRNINNEMISNLAQSISKLKDLKVFSYGSYKKLDEPSEKMIFKALEGMDSLKKLNLNFCNSELLSNHGLEAFVEQKNLQLEDLSINLNACKKFSVENLELLFVGVRSLPSLNKLAVDLRNLHAIEGDSLLQLLKEFKSEKSLKSFSVILDDSLDDSHLELFSKQLSNLKNLSSLSVCLENCDQITNNGLTQFSSSLKELKQLEFLETKLWISEALDFEFIKNLKPLESMRKLDLQIERIQSTESLKVLSETIRSFKGLNSFSIDVFQCDNINDMACKMLAQSLKKHKNLTELKLNFQSCFEVTDIGVEWVSSALYDLRQLKNLVLNFKQSKASNLGLKSICWAIQGLKHLSDIEFVFDKCLMSDQGLDYLQYFLNRIRTLEAVSISLRHCAEITHEAAENLERNLKYVKRSEINLKEPKPCIYIL